MSDDGMSDAELEQFRIAVEYMHSCPEQVIMRDTSLMRALIDRLDAAERERDAAIAKQGVTERAFLRSLAQNPDIMDALKAGIDEGLATALPDEIEMFRIIRSSPSRSNIAIARHVLAALTANHSAPVVED